MSKLAIMQPTFLPWLGYFALIDYVDTFVFLDDAQFSRQSWQNRNRLNTANGPILLSLPVARKPSKPLIKDALVAGEDNAKTIAAMLRRFLAAAPYREQVIDLVEHAFAKSGDRLADLNIAIIEQICLQIGISTALIRSSDIPVGRSSRSRRLLEIARHFEAEQYVSPPGSLDYLRAEDPFESSELDLLFFN